MKWSLIISVSALLGTVVARSVRPWETNSTRYRLLVTTIGGDRDVDHNYLSCEVENNTIGIFNTDHEPTQIYAIRTGEKSGRYSLHTRPPSELDHALGLLGWKGNLHLKNILRPHYFELEKGDMYSPDVYSWTEFTLKDGKMGMKELFWDDKKDDRPGWVATSLGDASYFIRWYDGSAYVVQNYVPVKILLQPVKD
ncbi:hypothetical protein ACHAPT_002877 [Fusarium lateritium]